jgi:Acetyltransferase (GNAT) domain
MKIVSKESIDQNKWADWCNQSPESQPFLDFDYLNSVSENLLFLINDSETGGIALPYFERLKVKTLYTPVLCRWVDWVGQNKPSNDELTSLVKSVFPQADIYFRQNLLTHPSEELIYQGLNSSEYNLNSQAKRKIKNLEGEHIYLSTDFDIDESVQLIRKELSNKFETLIESNFDSLEVLVHKLHENNKLVVKSLKLDSKIVGALFLVKTDRTILYLKGACRDDWKNKGGMYLLMNSAIVDALESNLNFDFGGSRIAGVRQFNQSFGGQDRHYYRYQWSNGPFWYNFIKTIRNKWKRK